MQMNANKNRFLNVFNKLTILVIFFVLVAFICLKAKYDNLASDYLRVAPKVGKYYAISCVQHEQECRLLLQNIQQETSTRPYWIDKIFRDQLLQQQFHQVVLDYFEKEIALMKNRITQVELRCKRWANDSEKGGVADNN